MTKHTILTPALATYISLGYIFIMAINMLIMSQVFHIQYGDPRMVTVLFFGEIALSIYATIMAKIYCPQVFQRTLRAKGFLWMLPLVVMLALLYVFFLSHAPWLSPSFTGILLILATTLLIGYSEELMFRGIVFQTFLRHMDMRRAVLGSALLFAALHIVNILGGVPLGNEVLQFLWTYFLGITYACILLQVRVLWPLMLYHALWDNVLLAGPLVGYGGDGYENLFALFAMALGVVYLFVMHHRSVRGKADYRLDV